MNAVITVTGKDNKGIIAKVSTVCAEYGANIVDITQSVLRDYFVMFMIADITELNVKLSEFVDILNALGDKNALKIQVMHEDIFNAMHRI